MTNLTKSSKKLSEYRAGSQPVFISPSSGAESQYNSLQASGRPLRQQSFQNWAQALTNSCTNITRQQCRDKYPKRTLTFYKNVKLKRIDQFEPRSNYRQLHEARKQNKNKLIHIQKNPWNKAIKKEDVGYLIKRLNDTPQSLYHAFENMNKIRKSSNDDQQNRIKNNLFNLEAKNSNKFKPLHNINITTVKTETDIKNSPSKKLNPFNKAFTGLLPKPNPKQIPPTQNHTSSKPQKPVPTSRSQPPSAFTLIPKQSQQQQKILQKIQSTKKKYVQQYRKMLLGMKAINLDTDLPRIKYVEQNMGTEQVNAMHFANKL